MRLDEFEYLLRDMPLNYKRKGVGAGGKQLDRDTGLSPLKEKRKEGIEKYNRRLLCISKKVPARLVIKSCQPKSLCQGSPVSHSNGPHEDLSVSAVTRGTGEGKAAIQVWTRNPQSTTPP